MKPIDRRRFLGVTTGAIVSTLFGGCASLATASVRPIDGVVRLSVRNYPMLTSPGGSLRILPEGASTPLYVLALGEGDYAVLSPICTHLACTVNIEGPRLVCPCHGSTYDREGLVLKGPAQRPLKRLASSVTSDGVLEIDLEGEE